MTFHAYCNELLKANGRGFGVLDDKDLWIYLRKRLRDFALELFRARGKRRAVPRRSARFHPALPR